MVRFSSLPVFFRPLRHSALWLGLALMGAHAALAQQDVSVPVATLSLKSVGQGFEMDGVIQAVKQSTVSAQTSGRVLSLAVKAGERVRSGQVLASIDDSEARTGVQRSQAQVAQASAEVRQAQASYERTQELLLQGFVSSAAMDDAQARFKSAQAVHEQAQAGVAQAALSQGFTRISAPFDGWVQQTLVDIGDLAQPGKPLLTLYAPGAMRVVVQVPVSRSRLLGAAGQRVQVQVTGPDGGLQWIEPGKVQFIPNADAVSQTVEWRLDLPPGQSQGVFPGQQVRVRFASGQAQRLLVPTQAVLHRGELTAVYVVAGQGFVLKAVRLGADHADQGREVLAGLHANDQVALDPVRAGLQGARMAAPTPATR